MTLPETRGLPTAETMDSEEGAELVIQNIAMDDIDKNTEVQKDVGIQNVAMDGIELSEDKEKVEGEDGSAEVQKVKEEEQNGTKEEE